MYGASSDEEKRLTMMLFSNIFDSLSKMVSNKQDTNPLFLYFVDRASRYKFLLMTNLMPF